MIPRDDYLTTSFSPLGSSIFDISICMRTYQCLLLYTHVEQDLLHVQFYTPSSNIYESIKRISMSTNMSPFALTSLLFYLPFCFLLCLPSVLGQTTTFEHGILRGPVSKLKEIPKVNSDGILLFLVVFLFFYRNLAWPEL